MENRSTDILHSEPICTLTGNEFLPQEGITFAEQVLRYFNVQGGSAMSPWGSVLLDMKGIQSDKSHGIGRIKASSFAAIKDVIEKGEIILPPRLLCDRGKEANDRNDSSPHQNR